jgi:hypothetical protein
MPCLKKEKPVIFSKNTPNLKKDRGFIKNWPRQVFYKCIEVKLAKMFFFCGRF